MRRLLVGLLVGFVIAVGFDPRDAAAQPSPSEQARQALREGSALYRKGRFEEALRFYERAHALFPGPKTVFNLAQASRRLGRTAVALRYYRKYLQLSPDAPNADEVRQRIARLEAEVAETKTSPVVPAERPARLPAPLPPPPSPPLVAAPPVAAPDADPPGRPRAWYRRWYVWTAIGAAVVGGVVGGVVAGTRDPYGGLPHTSFSFR
jgi:tetratricopeptide (TPR) repeat protein